MDYTYFWSILYLLTLCSRGQCMSNSERWELEQENPGKPPKGYFKVGDMLFPLSDLDNTRAAVDSEDLRWPRARVPFVIAPGINGTQRYHIELGMYRIAEKTCIRFYNRTTEDYYLYFQSKPSVSDCSTVVGYRGTRPGGDRIHEVDMGMYGCPALTISHEVMHALSFKHEQSRNDRDLYVYINETNIDRSSASSSDPMGNFRKDKDSGFGETLTYGLPYNYESIMHYGPFFYSKKRDVPGYETIIATPRRGAIGDPRKMGQEERITDTDYELMNKHYRCVQKDGKWYQQNESENEVDNEDEESAAGDKGKTLELKLTLRKL